MEKLSKELMEVREIRAKRIKKGRIESKIYPSVFLVFCFLCAVIGRDIGVLFFGVLLSVWLFPAFSFSRELYGLGSIAYGLYVFYVLTCVLPYKEITRLQIVSYIIFIIYIVFSTIRIFSSENVKAYIYDKNNI